MRVFMTSRGIVINVATAPCIYTHVCIPVFLACCFNFSFSFSLVDKNLLNFSFSFSHLLVLVTQISHQNEGNHTR